MVTAVVVAGCGGGGGGDGGYTRDDIASALALHLKHHDEVTYTMAPGKDCVVDRVWTSSDEVKSAQSVANEVPDGAGGGLRRRCGRYLRRLWHVLPGPVCCTS